MVLLLAISLRFQALFLYAIMHAKQLILNRLTCIFGFTEPKIVAKILIFNGLRKPFYKNLFISYNFFCFIT